MAPMNTSMHPQRRPVRRAAALCLAALLLSNIAVADEVQVARPWRYRVFADQLPAVDDIVVYRDGDVYVTLGLEDGDGRVLRLRGGKTQVVASKLDRPRGLALRKHSLYVTEQVSDGRVIEINLADNTRRVIENLSNPGHIVKLPGGDLAVTEEGVSGRLMRLMPNGAIEVITAGLNYPEGLSVARDGTIYVGESGTGRVLAYRQGELNVVVDDLDELGQIEVALDGSLWITEVGTPGRLLHLRDGAIETVLSGLKEPRGIAVMDNGAVLVAERGRSRILLVEPKP